MLFLQLSKPTLKKSKQPASQHAKKLRDLKKVLGNRQLAIEVQGLKGGFFHNIVVNYLLNSKFNDIPYTIKHDYITLPMSQALLLIYDLNALVNEFFGSKDISFKFDVL